MLSLRDFDGDGLFTLAKVPPAPVMCKVMNCRIFQSYSYCSALRTNTSTTAASTLGPLLCVYNMQFSKLHYSTRFENYLKWSQYATIFFNFQNY